MSTDAPSQEVARRGRFVSIRGIEVLSYFTSLLSRDPPPGFPPILLYDRGVTLSLFEVFLAACSFIKSVPLRRTVLSAGRDGFLHEVRLRFGNFYFLLAVIAFTAQVPPRSFFFRRAESLKAIAEFAV